MSIGLLESEEVSVIVSHPSIETSHHILSVTLGCVVSDEVHGVGNNLGVGNQKKSIFNASQRLRVSTESVLEQLLLDFNGFGYSKLDNIL